MFMAFIPTLDQQQLMVQKLQQATGNKTPT
jgi:hypothetical protein